MYNWSATLDILADIKQNLEDKRWLVELEWELGDFAIIDNLALAHYAHPDTQADPATAGLRGTVASKFVNSSCNSFTFAIFNLSS